MSHVTSGHKAKRAWRCVPCQLVFRSANHMARHKKHEHAAEQRRPVTVKLRREPALDSAAAASNTAKSGTWVSQSSAELGCVYCYVDCACARGTMCCFYLYFILLLHSRKLFQM